MDVILVMLLGVLVGATVFPVKGRKINEKFQLICTLTLIFSMGLMLGRRENFFGELLDMGLISFVAFFFPVLFSVIFVYFLTKKYMENKKEE